MTIVETPGVIVVSPPPDSGREWLQALFSSAGAVAVAALGALAILLVGLPVALAGRGVVELIDWIVAVFR